MTDDSNEQNRRFDAATMTGVARAAACIAAHHAGDTHGAALQLARARREGTLYQFALAAVDQAARLARVAYRERAQVELDAWALDAGFFRERESGASPGSGPRPGMGVGIAATRDLGPRAVRLSFSHSGFRHRGPVPARNQQEGTQTCE